MFLTGRIWKSVGWRTAVLLAMSLVLAGAPVQAHAQAQAGAQTVKMPGTEGETLSGKRLMLSQAVAGHASVLVMGFSHEAGDLCTDWGRALRGDPALAGTHVYGAAMLAAAPAFVRGMIRSGMRKGMSDAEQEDFVILVKDEQSWRNYFGVSSDKEPQVVLLDAQGKVRWQGHGLAKDLEPQLRAALK